MVEESYIRRYRQDKETHGSRELHKEIKTKIKKPMVVESYIRKHRQR